MTLALLTRASGRLPSSDGEHSKTRFLSTSLLPAQRGPTHSCLARIQQHGDLGQELALELRTSRRVGIQPNLFGFIRYFSPVDFLLYLAIASALRTFASEIVVV